MTSRHSKHIEKALIKMGFKESDTHHRRFIYCTKEGFRTRVKSFVSHGSKDYGDFLLNKISKQLHLNKQETLDLIDGKMSREKYEEILKNKGFI